MSVKISSLERKQVPFLAKLMNDEYEGSPEFIPFDEERFLSEIQRRRITVLVAEDDGRPVGFIGTHSDDRGEDIHWLATSKGPEGKAVKDMLVNEAERNAEGDTLMRMIDESNPEIKEWENRGYALEPGFQRMTAELRGPTRVPEVDEDIRLRTLKPGEEAAFVEAVNAGFGWERLEIGDLERWKAEDPPFDEKWVQVAEAKGKIVSVVVAKPDTDCNKYLHRRMGYMGPATTLPEFRNKHLASALTARAMNLLFEKDMNTVRLGTSEKNVSSIALLRSLGFHVENVRKILRKKLKDTDHEQER
jgi:ribosomal protein S18 acetylase RimI-like enzyme